MTKKPSIEELKQKVLKIEEKLKEERLRGDNRDLRMQIIEANLYQLRQKFFKLSSLLPSKEGVNRLSSSLEGFSSSKANSGREEKRKW